MLLKKMYIMLRSIKYIEDKIPNVTNLANKTTINK